MYLIHGRVAVKIHSTGYVEDIGSNFEDRAIPTLITSSTYNDTDLHQCQIIFSYDLLELIVDGSERQFTFSKKLHNA